MTTRFSTLLAFTALTMAAPALAQTDAAPEPAPAPPEAAPAQQPSPNAMENLIRLLVAQKVITAEQGSALLTQANAEAAIAQAKLAAVTPPEPGTVRVPYVPQLVKDQIRAELRAEVLAEAREARWVSPNAVPAWVDRVEWYGDIRFRSQSDLYDKANTNEFVDFARFNADGPVDVNPLTNPVGFPLLNTRRDRWSRFNIRARLGVNAKITDGVTAGIRLASGNDDGPVSTTQLMGGGFSKKDIWLDRAFVTLAPFDHASATFGRMANPFFATDLLYDEDLNFDGIAASFKSGEMFGDRVSLWATAGAFPFETSSGSFPGFSRDKARTRDKWIYGGQVGVDVAFDDRFSAKFAAAYYDFSKVRGRVSDEDPSTPESDPCVLASGNSECSSDITRPGFLAKGNTLMLLRNIAQNPDDPALTVSPQFVGLVFDYNILDLNAEFRARFSDDWALTIGANYVRNLGYKRRDICASVPFGLPVNNVYERNALDFDPCSGTARFRSGNQAAMLRATLGTPGLSKRGEWSASLAYKYIEPDAMLDSLTDSDFHLGGTNAKGYVLSANYMLWDNVRFGGRWLSANEIYGPRFGIDVLQFDLVVGF